MKPGEFQGVDGRTYQWVKYGKVVELEVVHLTEVAHLTKTEKAALHFPDWPAAKAALDALIEEEAKKEEWVEWTEASTINRYRIRRDGSGSIQRRGGNNNWYDVSTILRPQDAYFAGFRAGQEQGQDLAQIVLEYNSTSQDDFGAIRCHIEDMVTLAHTIKGR